MYRKEARITTVSVKNLGFNFYFLFLKCSKDSLFCSKHGINKDQGSHTFYTDISR